MMAIILVRQRFFVVNFKLNFEDQRDYSRAGDFHYDEMGIQRKRKMLEWE